MLAYLAPFLDEHGLTAQFDGGDVMSTSAKVKFQLIVTSPDGEARSREAMAFQRLAATKGMVPSDLGREFQLGKNTYRILGWNEQAQYYPIIVEKVDTHVRKKLTVDEVRTALDAAVHNARIDATNKVRATNAPGRTLTATYIGR